MTTCPRPIATFCGQARKLEQFEPAGFRYLQVTVRHCLRPLRLMGLTVNSTGYPVEARGRFACSDDQLTRMWQTGADTLGLCMHDAYVDCPTREQRQWVGDAYVQILVNFAAFGDPHLAARLLRQTAESQQPDGLTMPSVVSDFAVKDFFNIPDFCLYWILAIDRTVLFTGDIALAEELHPAIVKAVAWFERHLDADTLLAQVPHWVFVDWADVDKQGHVTARMLSSSPCCGPLPVRPTWPAIREAHRFAALADQVADAINRLLWDEERGVYVDARHRGVHKVAASASRPTPRSSLGK